MPPPANVFAEPLYKLMMPVPVTVKLVELAQFQTVPDPLIEIVPEPIAIVRGLLLLELKTAEAEVKAKLLPLTLKVPAVCVNTALLHAKSSCSVTDPPGVLMMNPGANVLVALVIVCEPRPANVNWPVPVGLFKAVPLIQLP